MAEKYEKVPMSVPVPATFVPTAEQFAPQVTQELRSQQSQWAQGYALAQIEHLENQLRMSLFKREPQWRDIPEKFHDSGEPIMYSEAASETMLVEAIRVAKTARTIMQDKISEWAGAYDKETFHGTVLPKVWGQFVRFVQDDGKPAPVEEAEEPIAAKEAVEDEALAPDEELEPAPEAPVLPSARYDDLAGKPQSEVVAPDQLSLGDVLAKLEKDNSED